MPNLTQDDSDRKRASSASSNRFDFRHLESSSPFASGARAESKLQEESKTPTSPLYELRSPVSGCEEFHSTLELSIQGSFDSVISRKSGSTFNLNSVSLPNSGPSSPLSMPLEAVKASALVPSDVVSPLLCRRLSQSGSILIPSLALPETETNTRGAQSARCRSTPVHGSTKQMSPSQIFSSLSLSIDDDSHSPVGSENNGLKKQGLLFTNPTPTYRQMCLRRENLSQ